MSWWSDLWDGFTGTDDQGGFFGGLGDLLGGIFNPEGDTKGFLEGLISMGLGSLIQGSGFADPKIPQTGYQGDIPDYTAVRERVPMQDDPNRRPGAGGRRYFSDLIYADAPEKKPISVEEAQAQAQQQAAGIASLMPSYSAPEEREETESSNPASDVINQMPVGTYEEDEDKDAIDTGGFTGGVMNAGGMYLGGTTDGMADDVRGNIGRDEVRLSDGEFVIPADVVSHLGNGNSNAGAAYLHDFMKDIRQERTGNSKQGKQINPNQFLQV